MPLFIRLHAGHHPSAIPPRPAGSILRVIIIIFPFNRISVWDVNFDGEASVREMAVERPVSRDGKASATC